MKTCAKCKVNQLKKCFHKDKLRPDGLFPYCKCCRVKKGSKQRIFRDSFTTHNGYIRVYAKGHKMSLIGNYAYAHRKCLFDHYGQEVLFCELCGADWLWRPYLDHVDHIDNDKTNNDILNLRPLCNGCNVKRSDKPKHLSKGRVALEYKGKTMTPEEWGRDPNCAVNGVNLRNRIKAGWSIEKAMTKPSRRSRN